MGLSVLLAVAFGLRDQYLLRLSPPTSSTYEVVRVWKANPKDTGNGNQVHWIRFRVDKGGPPHTRYFDLRITKFSGHGISFDKHLKEIAGEVEKTRMTREYSETGAVSKWNLIGYTNGGWAAMMAIKAIGVYEVGVFDFRYPTQSLAVGDSWDFPVSIADEPMAGQSISVAGNRPSCKCRLDSVDKTLNQATISFRLDTVVEKRYRDIIRHKILTVKQAEHHSGFWIVDLSNGMPVAFRTERVVRIEPLKGAWSASTETTSTTVNRLLPGR